MKKPVGHLEAVALSLLYSGEARTRHGIQRATLLLLDYKFHSGQLDDVLQRMKKKGLIETTATGFRPGQLGVPLTTYQLTVDGYRELQAYRGWTKKV